MRPNEISYKIIGGAMKVHSALGAGLLESAYEKALCYEFTSATLQYQRQVRLPVNYANVKISPAYTVDFVVEHCVVVELKAVTTVLPVHRAQLLSYLRLMNLPPRTASQFQCSSSARRDPAVHQCTGGGLRREALWVACAPLRPRFSSVSFTPR
jgi:GxxExxY protein